MGEFVLSTAAGGECRTRRRAATVRGRRGALAVIALLLVATGVSALAVVADTSAAEPGTGPPAEVGAAAGIDVGLWYDTYSMLTADFDGDGAEDVMVNLHAQGGVVFRARGGNAFERVESSDFDPSVAPGWNDRHGCDAADVNGDGRLDIYCNAGRAQPANIIKSGYQDNELWLQQADGSFIDVGTEALGRRLDTRHAGDRNPDRAVGRDVALPR